ncbi:hypothetical protein LSH36_648g01060 [Paralvinella palmiformis]|uniref:Uncharacterized protein n=1 Tax=Paralvinella palmiformis TaxID=53620 RepID=A0AAD9MUH0_9ANNE|nr:hypothetical protein LSH36_648g01060 [Paralvinella palmiformis]
MDAPLKSPRMRKVASWSKPSFLIIVLAFVSGSRIEFASRDSSPNLEMSFSPSAERSRDRANEKQRYFTSLHPATYGGGIRVKMSRLPATKAPVSAGSSTIDKHPVGPSMVGDRLFSGTSLRNITAANIREREYLVHKYQSIETAAKTSETRLEHQKVAVRRKAEWLKAKLEDKPWRRQLQKPRPSRCEPPPGGIYGYFGDTITCRPPTINVETDADVDDLDYTRPATDTWLSRDETGTISGRTSCWRTGSDSREQPTGVGQARSGTVTMDEVRQLARRLYTSASSGEGQTIAEQRELRIVDFLVRMLSQIEANLGTRQQSNSNLGHFSGDAFSRLVTALWDEDHRLTARSSTSSLLGDDKRRRYLEKMNITVIRLPPVYRTEPFKLQERDWNNDDRTPAPPKLTERDWLELRHCRYLRQKMSADVSEDKV